MHTPLSPSARPGQTADADRFGDLLPLGDWYRHHSLRSFPVLLFLALICVPSIALYIVGSNATTTTFDAAAWIFAAYFAVAWLLLLGVIIRPMHVTRLMLLLVTVLALLTEVPLAVALETSLHATNASLLPSIVTIGLPEEIAKALPVLVVALIYRGRRGLTPRDYLFIGAVSGLVFGAGEVVRYFTVNGVEEFYQTVQGAIPSIVHLIQNGHAPSTSIFAALIGPVLYFILNFVWRFVTDPISHACWAWPDRVLHRAGGDRQIPLVPGRLDRRGSGRHPARVQRLEPDQRPLHVDPGHAGQRNPVPRLREGRVSSRPAARRGRPAGVHAAPSGPAAPAAPAAACGCPAAPCPGAAGTGAGIGREQTGQAMVGALN